MAISDPKAPFFYKPVATKAPPVTMPVIQFVNDPQYRVGFGMWLYERFNGLSDEYKKYGRFLTLQEIESGSYLP